MICCVRKGPRYQEEYVTRLRDGVMRHLPPDSAEDFVCFTDEKPIDGVRCEPLPVDLPRWWGKVGLYQLNKPLIFFDLDVVIVGSLKPLLDWEGFGILRNPWLRGFNSSVMKLTGNEGFVWERFTPGVMASMRGDQDWINVVYPDAPVFPLEWFPSWKVHKVFKRSEPPEDAIAINLHGRPKPAELPDGWVKDHWLGQA